MDTTFFILSKLFGELIRAENWLIAGMGIAFFALLRSRLQIARLVLGVTFVATLLMAIFPVGEWLLRPLESHYLVNPELARVDGIVVLGMPGDVRRSKLWGQTQLKDGAERYTAALELARRFPDAKVVFAGGSGQIGDLGDKFASESSVAEDFFLAQGLDSDRLVLERSSRNTRENAINSFVLVKPQQEQTWLLVTSAFHMPRALRNFERAGWPALVPYPVDYRSGAFVDGIGWDLAENLFNLNLAVKEYVGLLVYGLKGQ